MATYYVSQLGSNTAPYDTWEKAASLPHVAAIAAESTSMNTIYIAPGEYDSYLPMTAANWWTGKVFGTSAHGSLLPDTSGQVVINCLAGYHGVQASQNHATVSGVIVKGADSGHYNWYITSADFVGDYIFGFDSLGNNIVFDGSAKYNISHSGFFGAAGSRLCEIIKAQVGSKFSQSVFRNSASMLAGASTPVIFHDITSIEFDDCVVIGGGGPAIWNNSTGSISLKGSIASAGLNGVWAINNAGTGQVHAEKCLLVGGWSSVTIVNGGLTTDTDNIKTNTPRFVGHTTPGIITLAVDDTTSIDYVESLEPLFASYGAKGQFNVNTRSIDSGTLTRLNGLQSRGVFNIGGHSYSHSTLDLTGDTYAITKAGATISVNRASDTITVTPGGDVSEYKSKNLNTIQAELESLGCTIGALQTYLVGTTLGEVMQDSIGAQDSPYTPQLLIDTTGATGFFKVEIADVKTYLEQNISGYVAKSFATPGGHTSPDVESTTKAVGWMNQRNHAVDGESVEIYLLKSIGVYHTNYMSLPSFKGADIDETKLNLRKLLEVCAQCGTHFDLLSHSTAEFTLAEWEVLLSTLRDEYPEILVTNMDGLVDLVYESGEWATADGVTFTKTFTDETDFHILPTSPCIGAGAAIAGITTDIEGNQLYAPHNIGPYGATAGVFKKSAAGSVGKAKYNLLISGDTYAFPLCNALWLIDQAAGGDFFFNSASANAPIYRTDIEWLALPFVNKSDDGRVGIGPKAKYVYSVIQGSISYTKAQKYIGNV